MEHFDARDECSRLEDGLLADQMVDLSRFLVGNDLLSLLVYAFRPPGRFAAFLHEPPDVRSECMQWCHQLWDTLEAAEHDAQSDPCLKSFLVSLGWTQETWSREMLVACAESGFQAPPPDALPEIQHTFRGMGTTKSIEDSFGHLRDEERQSKAGMMSCHARWHRCFTSGIAEDADRKQPCPTSVDKAASAPALPRSVFSDSSSEFSMGPDKLAAIQDDPSSWASPSPASYELTESVLVWGLAVSIASGPSVFQGTSD